MIPEGNNKKETINIFTLLKKIVFINSKNTGSQSTRYIRSSHTQSDTGTIDLIAVESMNVNK